MKRLIFVIVFLSFLFSCSKDSVVGPTGPAGEDGEAVVSTNHVFTRDIITGTMDSTGNVDVINANVVINDLPDIDCYIYFPAAAGGAGWYNCENLLIVNEGIIRIFGNSASYNGYSYMIILIK